MLVMAVRGGSPPRTATSHLPFGFAAGLAFAGAFFVLAGFAAAFFAGALAMGVSFMAVVAEKALKSEKSGEGRGESSPSRTRLQAVFAKSEGWDGRICLVFGK
jgi:hypothetical protein